MSRYVPQVIVGGVLIDVSSFRTQRGTYGAIGTCKITTNNEVLTGFKDAGNQHGGLNILKANQAAPGSESSLPIVISISTDGGKTFNKLWAGDMDSASYNFQSDEVEITGRDFAARLYDDRIVLKQDEYLNKHPYEIAIALAKDAGLTPKVTIDPTQQLAGNLYEENAVSLLSLPRPKWDILVFLARAVGWEVYTTVNQELVFGPPAPATKPIVFTWKLAPGSVSAFGTPGSPLGTPVKNLSVDYQPRRNMTFQVLVLSYHPKTEAMSSERVIVLDQEITIDTFRTARAGVWKGSAAGRLRSVLASKLDGRPLYVFYPQGKTPQEVQAEAERIYFDIARKLFIASGEIDGMPSLDLQQTLQIAEVNAGELQGFAGVVLTFASISHRFHMGSGVGKDSGFVTEFKAHYLPISPSSTGESPILVKGGSTD